MNQDQLDTAWDYITYITTGVCFIGAIIFVTMSVIDTLEGWKGVEHHLYNAGILMAMGIGMSLFVIYVKGMAGKE